MSLADRVLSPLNAFQQPKIIVALSKRFAFIETIAFFLLVVLTKGTMKFNLFHPKFEWKGLYQYNHNHTDDPDKILCVF